MSQQNTEDLIRASYESLRTSGVQLNGGGRSGRRRSDYDPAWLTLDI
jgi:hypothetical protein